MRALAVAVVLVGWLPVTALANGRPPSTNGVHFRPGDRHSLYVATTFGLLISHDDGCSFRWICEDNIGYAGTFDPKYRIAADGTLFATTFNGLRVSRDGGCSFTTATADRPADDPGRIADRWIDAIDIGPTGEVWVATADNGKPNNVYRSTDNGLTFEPRGMLSPAIWWKSVLVAPTHAARVYATGYQVAGAMADGGQMPPTTHVQITDDGGEHWTPSPLAGVQYGSTPLVYVVGVDHASPDIVVMMSAGANPPSGDRLYRSTDGGMTWAEVLATTASILDVSLSDAGGVLVATLGGGAFQSTDHGASF
ncbi:MAG: exo-alpha-sialidase, partial [Myxococcales bacterium]|nr:exo-alpha-sialidase [Myxococcales bacterium]